MANVHDMSAAELRALADAREAAEARASGIYAAHTGYEPVAAPAGGPGGAVPAQFRLEVEHDGVAVVLDQRRVRSEEVFDAITEAQLAADAETEAGKARLALRIMGLIVGDAERDQIRAQLMERDGYVDGWKLNEVCQAVTAAVLPKN